MIKLNNLDKYFNRKKANEIHVINDISLTLPDKGLVVLLGPSGSGKTTLLNVLGGLDKVQGGSIQFGEQEINGYSSKTWDKIRNKQVGYIFQNYNLLNNLTVYDNIALTLNMVNIYDKEEIDKRIDYILDSMGMINYRKRRASQLSGGQQQRVAIARALAKNPKVIIADEPTGNLDSKNTQDIMNIIKKISLNKLVVLVTHEENIANFYADRVIKLVDGCIVSDDSNSSEGGLDVKHDTDIYLGDLREVNQFDSSNAKIKLYSDEDVEDNLDIRLIVKNKTLYLDVKSKEYKKIQLLESDSEINIYDGEYKKLEKSDFSDTDFNLQSVITESTEEDKDRHSVITVKDSLKLAVSRLKGASRLGKLFYFGFAMAAVLVAVAVGMLSGIYNFDSSNFLSGSEHDVVFDKDLRDYDDIIALLDDESIEYFKIVPTFSAEALLPPLFQSRNNTQGISNYVVYAEYLDESKLIKGHKIESVNQIALDKDYADQLLGYADLNSLGITTYDDLFELDFYIVLDGVSSEEYKYSIELVGIVDDVDKAIYASKELVFMAEFHIGILELFEDDIVLETGTLPDHNPEVIINEEYTIYNPEYEVYPTILSQTFMVNGIFSSTEDLPRYLVTSEAMERVYFAMRYQQRNSDLVFHSNDKEATIDYLDGLGIEAADSYQTQLEDYASDRLANSLATLVFTFVVLGASAISYYFILRSSLLSRIYEVSVYRALGVSKGDIRKMFLTEILLITTITSTIGYLFATYFLYRFQLLVEDFTDIIYITPLSIVGGLGIIYLVNIIAGLIPVFNLLRKTPAEILSKYDF